MHGDRGQLATSAHQSVVTMVRVAVTIKALGAIYEGGTNRAAAMPEKE